MPRFSLNQYLRELARNHLGWSTFFTSSKRRRQNRASTLVLQAAEALESRMLLTAAAVPAGLVAWWTADNTAADVTGNNNGVITGTTFAPGEVGQAFSFDGVSNRVQVPDNPDLHLTHSLSIEGWVNVKGFPTTDGGEIFFRGDDRNGLDPYSLTTLPDGTIRFEVDSGNGAADVSAAIATNQFVYVAATLDDATGLMSLYLNGQLQTQITTTDRPFADLDPNSNPSIGIGNHGGYPSSPHNFPFDGLIDELSIYNQALTSTEIEAIYNAGSDGKVRPPSVTSVVVSGTGITAGSGDLGTGQSATLTVNFNAAMTVDTTGGSPTLSLNDGGTATYTGGSGTTALAFVYTVAGRQNTSDLSVTALNLNGATIQNSGTNADVSGATTNPDGILRIDTTNHPFAQSIVSSSPNTATSASFTVTFNEAVTGVDPTDFQAVTTGGLTSTSIQVTPVSSSVYTVTVNGIAGSGTLGLNLVNNGSIHDLVGNVLIGKSDASTFLIQQTYLANANPTSVATADLNGDGKLDAVVTNSSANSVSVLFGNTDGTFQPPQSFAVGTDPVSITIADVNGDHNLDLVVANTGSSSISVLLGNGNGTFQTQQTFAANTDPTSLAIGDLNGDHKPDVVVTNQSLQEVSVLVNNGDGTFPAPQTFATGVFDDEFGSGGQPDSIAVADLNGDGKLDLLIGNYRSGNHFNEVGETVDILLGNGNGTFGAFQTFTVGNSVDTPISVAAADLNGDGIADIIVGNYGGTQLIDNEILVQDPSTVSVLLGTGGGGFTAAQTYATGSFPSSLAVGDVNGDGIPDVVTSDRNTGSVTLLLGNADGTLQGQLRFATSSADGVTLADLNHDGALDVLIGNNAGNSMGVLLNNNGNLTGPVETLNHAPVGTTGTVFTLLNTPYTFQTADFGFSDPIDNPANTLAAVQFTILPSAGTIRDNGTALTAGQFVWAADIAGGKLTFTPTTNLSGGPYFMAQFKVQDNGGNVSGGQNLDPNPKVLYIRITHLNHAPAGTSGTVTTPFQSAYTFKTADFGFTDPNDAPPNLLQAVKITVLPTATVGTLTDNGTAVSAGQFVSAADISGGKLVYTPKSTLNGGTYALFNFQVQDDGGTAGGGVNLDPTARSMNVVIKVNHAPVGKSGTVTGVINTAYRFTTADFGFSDPNDNPPNTLLEVKITALPPQGTLTYNFQLVQVGELVGATGITQGKLVFTPNANIVGNGPIFLCNFQVIDNGGTAGGGQNVDPKARGLDIRFTTLNHFPIGTSGTVTANRNAPYTVKTSDFGFTDPNDSPANSFLAVKFTVLPTAGTLKDNGVEVTANQFVSVADITAGKLVFTPTPNLAVGTYFLAKFQVEDNGGTAGSGANLDPSAKVLNVKLVQPIVNHAPTGTSGTVTAHKNTAYHLKTADFGFSDANDSPPNTLLAVKITLLPSAGTLTDNGVAVTVNQFISAADIAAGKLVFTPSSNLTGGPFFLFKFHVEDNGGTANGGINLDPTAKVLDVRILTS